MPSRQRVDYTPFVAVSETSPRRRSRWRPASSASTASSTASATASFCAPDCPRPSARTCRRRSTTTSTSAIARPCPLHRPATTSCTLDRWERVCRSSPSAPSGQVAVHRIGVITSATVRGDLPRVARRLSDPGLTEEKGRLVWTGSLAVKSELNRTPSPHFPVTQAVGTMEPGVYVMTAKLPARGDRFGRRRGRSLGRTGRPGGSSSPISRPHRLFRRRGLVLALSSAPPSGHNLAIRLVAKEQRRIGPRTPAAARIRRRSGARRQRPRARPRRGRTARATTAFLDLAREPSI